MTDITLADAVVKASIAIGASISVGLCGLAAAQAEASIGAASVGAFAENEKNFGKALLFTVVPESIAIFGLVVALILIFVF